MGETDLQVAQRLAHLGSWHLDLASRNGTWSDEMYRLFDRDPTLGPPTLPAFHAWFSSEDAGKLDAATLSASKGLKVKPLRLHFQTPGGAIRCMEARIESIRDADGSLVELRGTNQDVTAEELAEAMSGQIDEQNREVQRLKELSEMRLQFLNVAAHDLNTPLTSIILQLAVLRQKDDFNDSNKSALNVLARNIQRLKVLVQDMLDAACLQAGRLKLNRRLSEIRPLVEDAVKAFEEAANQNGLTIKIAPFDDAKVDVDPCKVSQVLYNLVSNAVKYTPKGGHIIVGVSPAPGALVIHVQDTGLGLTSEQISKMFAPFARFHEDVPGVAKGTGLGLYISRGIIEQHDGRLWVESRGPGLGSRFSCLLPLLGGTGAAKRGVA